MFERYTEKARRAIFFARYEASQSASLTIEPEHLLLGILRDNKDLIFKLTEIKNPTVAIRRSIEHHVPSEQVISTSVELPLAPATKDILMKAHEASEALGHRHIGPEHLLLGILGDTKSRAAKALQASGISAERIRNLGNQEATLPDPPPGSIHWGQMSGQRKAEPTLQTLLRKSILECLDETFLEGHGTYLD